MKTEMNGKTQFSPVENGKISLNGKIAEILSLIEEKQLLRQDLWHRFTEQYSINADNDGGWRGEFFGKMMRGACMVYQCTNNPSLYQTLTDAVKEMMKNADESGRISTYSRDCEFRSWDVWCRKYVILGMEYYLEICKDEALKTEIINGLKRQADYLIEHIGSPNDGKLPINEASDFWRGLNASSVLISVVRLYELTSEQKYLDFASYIVSQGGTQVANVFELAYEDKFMPYQYPVTKAYELTSCFEGLLEYYKVTGEEKYKTTLERYASRLLETDFTVIGSAGCTEELLDHSTVRQANTTNGTVKQETCVTVTLMIFFYKMLILTGDAKYADAFETALYNGYLGTVNTENQIDRCLENRDVVKEPVMFDSYSPLTAGTRGNGVGGFMVMRDKHYYGCCACIGSGGIGVLSQISVTSSQSGIVINLYNPGVFSGRLANGDEFSIKTETDYPKNGKIKITLSLSNPESFDITLRVPKWSKDCKITVNGEKITSQTGYNKISRKWQSGDEITLELDFSVSVVYPIPYGHDILMNRVIWSANYIVPTFDYEDEKARHHIALRRGPVIMAEDDRFGYSVDKAISPIIEADGSINAEVLPDKDIPFPCNVALSVPLKDGMNITLVDYGSAGKMWGNNNRIAAWLLTE